MDICFDLRRNTYTDAPWSGWISCGAMRALLVRRVELETRILDDEWHYCWI